MPRRPHRISDQDMLAELHRAMHQGALDIGDVSRLLRAENGLSQSEFADSLQVALNVIKDIESGRGNPSLQSIEKLAAAAGLRVALIAAEAPSVVLVSSQSLAREESRRRRHALGAVVRGQKSLERHDAENALRIEGAHFNPVDVPA
ncbi:MAG: helix-turn-helix domain-containing protein [Gammaproteobacteria bacterium]